MHCNTIKRHKIKEPTTHKIDHHNNTWKQQHDVTQIKTKYYLFLSLFSFLMVLTPINVSNDDILINFQWQCDIILCVSTRLTMCFIKQVYWDGCQLEYIQQWLDGAIDSSLYGLRLGGLWSLLIWSVVDHVRLFKCVHQLVEALRWLYCYFVIFFNCVPKKKHFFVMHFLLPTK